ncbi:transposase [Lawsonibacter sp. LCP25S3_G6]|uniref:transposase n=1 Tax=unclassified Lawsonibacter TaxID=2617946 RepID=UPI003F9C4AD3
MPKKYSDVEKQEILTAYQHGQTLANIGGKFGVAPSTIYRWVKDKKECITEENMLPMDIRNLLFQKDANSSQTERPFRRNGAPIPTQTA